MRTVHFTYNMLYVLCEREWAYVHGCASVENDYEFCTGESH